MKTTKFLASAIAAATAAAAACSAALAVPFTFTPDVAHNSVSLEGLVPVKQFLGINLPKGSIQFEDGMLGVTIVPDWNFDRVPVLEGPIIRTEVTTNERQALISGVVLFTHGFWYDRYWTPGSRETVITNGGTTVVGKITDMTATELTVAGNDGSTTVIPLADIKELHSPRAYAFAVPALAASPVTADTSWTADVQTVSLASTVAKAAGPVIANVRRDPLLVSNDTDWSVGKMVVLGTALSLVNAAQFVPYIVLPQFSHQLWNHQNKKSFFTLTTPTPPVPAPLINGNTYSLPIPFNQSH